MAVHASVSAAAPVGRGETPGRNMLVKALFALPFAFALIAAKAPPPPAEPVMPSIAVPADVAANPANKLTLELSNGGTVVIQLRPDIAPKHVERVQALVRQGF